MGRGVPVSSGKRLQSLNAISNYSTYNGSAFYFKPDQKNIVKWVTFDNCSFRSIVCFVIANSCEFNNCSFQTLVHYIAYNEDANEVADLDSTHCIYNTLAPYLTHIDLESANLTKLHLKEKIWPSVEMLHVGNNPLDQFPKELLTCANLDTLKLNSIGISELPDNIGKLGMLRTLDLSGNRLARLPETIGDLEYLEELDLSNNANIRTIPESVIALISLRTLNLSGTSVTGDPLCYLCNMSHLDEVIVPSNVNQGIRSHLVRMLPNTNIIVSDC